MLLSKKDGIACDTCGKTYRDEFTYYSFESDLVTVDAQHNRISKREKDLDLDVCETCYNNMYERVKKNLAPKELRNTIKCDFCAILLKGAFQYHRVLIHKVLVDKKQQEDGPASVEEKHFDLRMHDDCFNDLVKLAMETRQKVKQKGEWS